MLVTVVMVAAAMVVAVVMTVVVAVVVAVAVAVVMAVVVTVVMAVVVAVVVTVVMVRAAAWFLICFFHDSVSFVDLCHAFVADAAVERSIHFILGVVHVFLSGAIGLDPCKTWRLSGNVFSESVQYFTS